MEAVTMLSDKLLSLVRNTDVSVLPNHIDPVMAFAIVLGGAVVVGTWIVVFMIAASLSPKQGVLLEHPRD